MLIEDIIEKHYTVIKNITVENNFDEITDLIINTTNNKNKILVSGVGKAGLLGNIISANLTSIDIVSISVSPTDIQHGDLGLLQDGDLLIVISNSGKTREIIEFIDLARNKFKNTKVILFTNNINSIIATKSDFILNGNCTEELKPLEMVPTLSLISLLTLSNILISLILEKTNFTKYEYGFNHFGGYLGKKSNVNEKYIFTELKNITNENIISGIYIIRNLTNNNIFIEKSNNIYKTWNELYNQINNKIHKNHTLQEMFYLYGLENFQFEILEKVNEDNLNETQERYIKRFYKKSLF